MEHRRRAGTEDEIQSQAKALSVKRGISLTEAVRLLRTNTLQVDVEREIRIFSNNLQRKGFPVDFIHRILCKRQWHTKERLLI